MGSFDVRWISAGFQTFVISLTFACFRLMFAHFSQPARCNFVGFPMGLSFSLFFHKLGGCSVFVGFPTDLKFSLFFRKGFVGCSLDVLWN